MRAGLRLIPEHPLLGVGADAHKHHWREWGFPGDYVTHTHSTPIQIALDRGLPALGCYVWLIGGAPADDLARLPRRGRPAGRGPHARGLWRSHRFLGQLAGQLQLRRFGSLDAAACGRRAGAGGRKKRPAVSSQLSARRVTGTSALRGAPPGWELRADRCFTVFRFRGTPSACASATGGAACAALWPRSGGCARG